MSRIGGYLPEPVARGIFLRSARVSSRAPPVRSARRRRSTAAIASPAAGRSAAALITRRTSWASRARKAPTARTSRRCAAISIAAMSSSTTRGGCRACAAREAATSRSAILFVPEQHTHVFMGLRPTQDGIVYRLPAVSVFAWTVSVVPLGIARGAMSAFAELASRKARQGASAAAARPRDRAKQLRPGGRAASRGARFPDRCDVGVDGGVGRRADRASSMPARCSGRPARMRPKARCGSSTCSPPKRERSPFSRRRRSSALFAMFTRRSSTSR